MKHRHKVHKMASGGASPATGVNPTDATPKLVAGNKNVVEAAKSTKSIGKISGIYAKGRADRGRKVGASSDE